MAKKSNEKQTQKQKPTQSADKRDKQSRGGQKQPDRGPKEMGDGESEVDSDTRDDRGRFTRIDD